ncbi:MAG: bifunctional acetate--CoA ligase family protein/GNAT family N-acetyltransferase [bacterium]|nr:bifunctional acetate--CoA ligase family protein/GNAT family N-acetyltransferase [bacterium]
MKPSHKPGKPATETAHDIYQHKENPLDVFFKPKNVAVIGATEAPGSVGRTTLWNLISTPFGGAVFPVNPKRDSVLGIKAYRSIKDVPAEVDLAVVVTRASFVPNVIKECAEEGVEAAIVISAGFKELGPEGLELEHQLLANARAGGMRIIGPNCLGLMCPPSGVNATFAAGMARPGNIGFISQSGALCTAVLDWSFQQMVGFSAFISIGSMVDVGWGDLIDYLGQDPKTRAILVYMESVGDARSFLSAAREVALTKPIIVIKAGRTEAGGKAAASHTGSMTGSDDVLNAAFRRSGILRVNNISDLFYTAEVLSKQPRPKGPKLSILTNAGGPAVLATDSLISSGGQLADVSAGTMDELNAFLPPHWSRNNPIDILGDAGAERYAKSLEIAAKDPNSDGMLVVLTPQAMTDATQTAELLKSYAKMDKPVLASWMGGPEVAAGDRILNGANIPTFPYPDTAARIFQYMWSYSYNLRGLYETPILPAGKSEEGSDRAQVKKIIDNARKGGRTLLTEHESKQVLAAYGIPTVPSEIATTAAEAVKAAEKIGYPVVLKLHSETVTHKTDVGGVQLNLKDAAAVTAAFEGIKQSVEERASAADFMGVTVQPMIKFFGYELIIGSSIDPQFGPVLLFGMGGQLVEVFKDRSLALPPLNTTLARRMMEQTKIYKALQGVRGRKPIDLSALEGLMVRFSRLVVEQKWIKELDINPLLASSAGLLALDARVLLHPVEMEEEELPKLAIRPYPIQYTAQVRMSDGTEINVRPIRPEDEPRLVRFHETLSERTVYYRYLEMLQLTQRVAHERLTRICFIDYDREIALVAERIEPSTGLTEIIGVGRLDKTPGASDAELAVVVSDSAQGKGLGSLLVKQLIDVAKQEKIAKITAQVLPDNAAMKAVFKREGFALSGEIDDPTLTAELKLG